jgi:hypothetical protein
VTTCSNCGEQNPERARFCLRCGSSLTGAQIQRSVDQLNDEDRHVGFRVRMGANTGEVVVAFGAGPQIGERVTGYAVNTASRLQTSADAVREFAFVTADHPVFRTLFVPIAVRILVAAGALEEAVALAEDDAEVTSPRGELSVETARAIVAEARGELADAARRYADLADRWRSYGFSLEEGHSLLGAGRCLIDVGRPPTRSRPCAVPGRSSRRWPCARSSRRSTTSSAKRRR